MSIQAHRYLWGAIALTGLALSSCVDKNYDLDDIDKDYEIKVDHLVLPVKLDAFQLSSVFNLDENSVIKETDGNYAVVFEGSFQSEPVRIHNVTLNVGQVEPINTNIYTYSGTDVTLPDFEVGEMALAYEVGNASTAFELTGINMDNCLRQLDVITGDMTIHFTFNLKDINGLFKTLAFQNLKLRLPKGFVVKDHPADADGCITIPSLNINTDRVTTYDLVVTEINTTMMPAGEYTFVPGPGISPSSLSLRSNVGINGGYVVAVTNKTTTSTPQQVDLVCTPELSPISITSISGKVDYHIDGLSIGDLALEGLPDFLTQSGTDIALTNPQLYLDINNPLADYRLEGSAGLSLTALRENEIGITATLPASQSIVIGYDKGIEGPYNFCLAPSQSGIATGYKYLSFPDFGTLLSGPGLPDKIRVNFIDPIVNEGYVTDFRLGKILKPFSGSYKLEAPLAFNAGSKIVYENRETGWNDDTLLKLTVSELEVSATLTNPLPFDIIMTGYPLDENGEHLTDLTTGQPVQLIGIDGEPGIRVKAGETADILLHTDGSFKGIDGISYEARCVIAKPGVTIGPDMTISVENIRATVSGSYVDSF